MKNRIITFLIIIGFFFLLPVKTFAADSATILFDSGNDQFKVGNSVSVDMYINSNVPVNAVQLSITYPQSNFSLLSIDSAKSAFAIKAQEAAFPGLIKIARGNIQPLQGKKLLTTLHFKILNPAASTVQLGYLSKNSMVMTTKSTNVLLGSSVVAQKPPEISSQSTIHSQPQANSVQPSSSYVDSTTSPSSPKGIFGILSQAVKEFFRSIFH